MMKIGDWVKLSKHPRDVGELREIHPDGTCVVVDVFDTTLTKDCYCDVDDRLLSSWEAASDQDVFDARFLNGVDYDDWWRCRSCCSTARSARELDLRHEKDCPVAEALALRTKLAALEHALVTDIADYLAAEGYPWTANEIRDGSWRRKR